MLLQDEVKLLRGVPLFASLEATKLKLLAFASDRVRFNPGETLFYQGDAADAAYVVLTGQVDLMTEADLGAIKVGEAGAQAVVGELAILSDKPRDQTVRARTVVETLRITKDNFHKLLACCPGTMAKVVRVLGERMADAT